MIYLHAKMPQPVDIYQNFIRQPAWRVSLTQSNMMDVITKTQAINMYVINLECLECSGLSTYGFNRWFLASRGQHE